MHHWALHDAAAVGLLLLCVVECIDSHPLCCSHAPCTCLQSQRRLLRAQAVEVNSQQDLLVTRAECDRLGTALSDHMAAADAVAENAARNGVSEDLVADLTAKLQGLRDFLDDAEQSRREIER
eukprot:m.52535 g.52535  ORF g.52535 m.52535 type:complete len:123 (+) comp6701_c0_seq1:343-711(+)